MGTTFGVNVPYLRGDYGHDLAENGRFPTWPCRFDPLDAYRPIIETRRIGLGAIRLWLCENAEGLRIDRRGAIEGVSERLLASVQIVQEAARLHGVQLYFALLDGNSCVREDDPITRAILSDADQAARFAERVVAPLTRALDRELVIGLDIVNEPETATAACIENGAEPIAWEHIGRAIRLAGQAARAEQRLPITSGTMHVFLPELWRSGAELDAIDVHVYHEDGGLPSRDDLARYVGDDAIRSLPLIGGELGIPKDPGPKSADSLINYLHNADRLGYRAAFLWQLEGDLVDKAAPGRPFTWLAGRVRETLERVAGR